jgi:hypothetical protein
MKYLLAASLLPFLLPFGGGALAKEGCIQSWHKGNFKTFEQLQKELRERFMDGKILRLSLCGTDSGHYFMVTVLEASGKVRVIQLPAH